MVDSEFSNIETADRNLSDASLMLTRTGSSSNTSEFGWKFSIWSIRFSICLMSVILASGNRTWCSQLMAEMVKSELIVRVDTILTYGLDNSSPELHAGRAGPLTCGLARGQPAVAGRVLLSARGLCGPNFVVAGRWPATGPQ